MKKIIVGITLAICDILVLVAIFYVTLNVRVSLDNQFKIPAFNYLAIEDFIFVIIMLFVLLFYEKIYILRYDFWQELKSIYKATILAYFIVLAVLVLTKTSLEYSRLFITIYFFFVLLLLPIAKRFIKRVIYKIDFFKYSVFVDGCKEDIEMLHEEFKKNWYLGMQPAEQNYDTIIVSSKGLSLDEINEKIEKYLHKNSSVYIIPYVTNINFANSNILEYSNIRYNTIQIENKLLIKKNIWIKQIFDLVLTFITFPFFLILHLFISLAIKLDSKGSIFFKQERLGKDNKKFLCYKYRTMYEDSDKLLSDYLKNNPDEVEYYNEYHKYKSDPRITKVGKILRATSLDELAQVINVLKGEMSLVGPRPYMVSESEKLGRNKYFILKVKPGITGLWQVSGRNNLTFKERNELEVWYIKNWSLWADFVILIKTIKVVITKVGAR